MRITLSIPDAVAHRFQAADAGLRLSRFFGASDGFWVGLQTFSFQKEAVSCEKD